MLQEITVGRRGRPRRTDAERRGGKIDWRAEQGEPWRLGTWNKMRETADLNRADQRFMTQRGRLFFLKEITELEMQALELWTGMLEKYDKWILGRSRSPASPSFERAIRGEEAPEDEERIKAFRANFDKAHGVVLRFGMLAEGYLNRICRDEGSSAMLPLVKPVLAALSVHYGLVERKR